MNADFLTFVNLIKDELTGEMTLESFDFEKIIKIAESQGMKTLLFSVLKKYNNDGRLKNASENFLEFEVNVTKRVFEYTKTQYEVNKVIKALEKEGISCVILKGDTLSSIYPHSELRMSGDTDILIDIKKEKKCLKLFKKMGCYVKKRTRTNNQSVIVHPKAGKFEIHISMDTKEVSEVWYNNVELVKEPYREEAVSGVYKYKTLSYTDTALNLVLHVVKHFISGISHMRMVTDTVLFMDRNYDKIDFKRVCDTLSSLNYLTFFKCLCYIGNVYLGLEKLEAEEKVKEQSEKILEDIYNCGVYGFDKLDGDTYTYSIYSQNRFEKFGKNQNKSYKNYKIKLLINDTFDLIFKNKYEMMTIYPVLKKHIYLLPFMYIYRFFSCAFNTVFGKKNKKPDEDTQNNQEFMEKRLELFEKMDMM